MHVDGREERNESLRTDRPCDLLAAPHHQSSQIYLRHLAAAAAAIAAATATTTAVVAVAAATAVAAVAVKNISTNK